MLLPTVRIDLYGEDIVGFDNEEMIDFNKYTFFSFSLGVYYYCYEAVKAIFEKAKGQGKPMSTAESMLAGALAGSTVVFATNPIWTVNVSFFYIKMK